MLDITGVCIREGETEPADECYEISEGSPWAVDAFCDMLRDYLKQFEAGEAGLWNPTEGNVPTWLQITVKRIT